MDPRLTANMNHRPGGLQESGLADVVACFLAVNSADDVGTQFVVAGAGAETAVKVVLHLRKEAGANLAVGGKAHAAARSAECLADGRDDTDLADAVRKGVAAGGFAGLARRQLDQRQGAANTVEDLAQV